MIASYIFGINAQPGGADALWGGAPENIRPVYFVSMILAATGYFAFLYYIFFRLKPHEVKISETLGFNGLYLIFIGILVPSAFWMPLTNFYVNDPGEALWLAIRLVLTIVGLASLALVWVLVRMKGKVKGTPYRLALLGSGYFTFHTLILDALLWTALFR